MVIEAATQANHSHNPAHPDLSTCRPARPYRVHVAFYLLFLRNWQRFAEPLPHMQGVGQGAAPTCASFAAAFELVTFDVHGKRGIFVASAAFGHEVVRLSLAVRAHGKRAGSMSYLALDHGTTTPFTFK